VSRRVLVVGGSGLIGSHAAVQLQAAGWEVTVASRHPVEAGQPTHGMPWIAGDYMTDDLGEAQLDGFDDLVFAAGLDIRHASPEEQDDAFWARAQEDGIPAVLARAKRAGVRRAVHISSYYHLVLPELATRNRYVRARQLADERSRALADGDFSVVSLNPPSVIGMIPGSVQRRMERIARWAAGRDDRFPLTAPPGGTNYMSVRSLGQAIVGALQRGEAGRAYLVGDENLTYREYFQRYADAAGTGVRIEEADADHPFQPDAFIVPGRGYVLAYEPDPADTALLGYQRGDLDRTVAEIVASALG